MVSLVLRFQNDSSQTLDEQLLKTVIFNCLNQLSWQNLFCISINTQKTNLNWAWGHSEETKKLFAIEVKHFSNHRRACQILDVFSVYVLNRKTIFPNFSTESDICVNVKKLFSHIFCLKTKLYFWVETLSNSDRSCFESIYKIFRYHIIKMCHMEKTN